MLARLVKRQRKETMKEHWNRWKMNHSVAKIAAVSFNKILELNHRHSKKRFETACKLLTKTACRTVKRDAFVEILKAVNMGGLRTSTHSGIISKSTNF